MWRICLPVFLLAALLSGLCFWLNLHVSPRAKWEMKRIVKDVLSEDPSIVFREKGLLQDTVMHVEKVDKWSGKDAVIVNVDEWNRPMIWTFTNRVELQREGSELTAELIQPKMEWRQLSTPSEKELPTWDPLEHYPTPLDDDQSKPPKVERPGSANFPIVIEIPSSRRKPNEMTMDQIHAALEDPTVDPEDAAEYRTELTKRFSISLACIAFCFVGIPLGVTAQRRETSIGFALSLAVAVAYFFFIFLGETFGEEDTMLPHILMWAPSVLFITIGAVLFHRLNRQ